MATNIEQLWQISKSSSRSIIGLMSGTSLDGLDVAHCVFQKNGPETHIDLLHFTTVEYDPQVKQELRKVVSKRQVDLEHLCNVNTWLAKIHGGMILKCLSKWNISPSSIDVIASHGQTVYHSPKQEGCTFPHSTLQIGDGDHIAVTTGIITVSDFRQKQVAAGGEGAPLALYGDYFLFSKKDENRIMLNIGGIANITCLYGDLDSTKALATDVGPGNTLIDAWMQKHFNCEFDKNSEVAFHGKFNEELMNELTNHEFFHLPFPKSTGPELFNVDYVYNALEKVSTPVSHSDVAATLTKFTAHVIIFSIKQLLENYQSFKIYVSGGGAHNPMLMSELRSSLPENHISTTDILGIPGDAKEAVLFATLANETLCGNPSLYKFGASSTSRTMPSVAMGKISFP